MGFASHDHDEAPARATRSGDAEVDGPAEQPSPETEAQAVAGRVYRTLPRSAAPPGSDDPLGGSALPAELEARLSRRRGSGAALPAAIAEPMGQLLGTDLSGVRVHADVEADQLSRAMRADAFTFGTDVYFARGRFDPSSATGQHLLAHELAHVAQHGPPSGGGTTIGRNDDPAERAAERTADSVVAALRRHAAAMDRNDADATSLTRAEPAPETLRRHGSPEHLILGNIGPKDLRRIPDAKALLKTLGMSGLGEQERADVREAIHIVLQERERVRKWQSQGAGPRGDAKAAEDIFQVKIVSLDNDAKGGAEKTQPVLATYGEMNTLADYFGSVEDLNAISNETMFKVLQTEREDYYTYLGKLFKELTAQDFITETYTVQEEGKDVEKEVDYYRPEAWYDVNLDKIFSATDGYTVTSVGRLSGQQFEGTQNRLFTAGIASMAAGMHGIDTAIDKDPGTKARGGGGVWGATARNACHFAPQSWNSWRDYHKKARDLALEAYRTKSFAGAFGGEGKDKAAELENEAWVNNGFGDHYLQDSFASGHLINKTLVMQWYLQFINDNWKFFGPSREEWGRLMQMTAERQPELSGTYSKDVDSKSFGPQAIEESKSGHEAFGTAGLINQVTPKMEPLLKWWRHEISQKAEKQTLTRTELLKAPGVDQSVIDDLVRLGMVLDQGKPTSSYIPYFGKDERLYKLNETPGLSHAKAASGEQYSAGETMTYAAYSEFTKNSLLQSGAGDLHNYFCLNGLDVANDENDVVFRIYGDYVMLTQGGGQGVEISANTAQMSRDAISELASKGTTSISVESIMKKFPSKARLPDKIFKVEVGAKGGSTETLPLDKWHSELHPMLGQIFTKGSGTFMDSLPWKASRVPGKTQLASLPEIVPHGGEEF